jgi:hypothetical protein
VAPDLRCRSCVHFIKAYSRNQQLRKPIVMEITVVMRPHKNPPARQAILLAHREDAFDKANDREKLLKKS